MNQLPTSIDKIYKKYALKIEQFLALFVIMGIAIGMADIEGQTLFIGPSFSILAILYFIGAFQRPDETDKSMMKIIGFKVLYISWSVVTMGLLFHMLKLPGASAMMNIGAISMGIAAVLVVINSLQSWRGSTTIAVIRTLILAFLYFALPLAQ